MLRVGALPRRRIWCVKGPGKFDMAQTPPSSRQGLIPLSAPGPEASHPIFGRATPAEDWAGPCVSRKSWPPGCVKTPRLQVRESTDRRLGQEHTFRMVHTIATSNERRPKAADDQAAPLTVFYVVETTGQVIGERHHRVCSHLFETSSQAHTELARLEPANASGAFSIWKGTTYIEPAEWLDDVIMADGTVIPARRGHYCPVCSLSPSPPPPEQLIPGCEYHRQK